MKRPSNRNVVLQKERAFFLCETVKPFQLHGGGAFERAILILHSNKLCIHGVRHIFHQKQNRFSSGRGPVRNGHHSFIAACSSSYQTLPADVPEGLNSNHQADLNV